MFIFPFTKKIFHVKPVYTTLVKKAVPVTAAVICPAGGVRRKRQLLAGQS